MMSRGRGICRRRIAHLAISGCAGGWLLGSWGVPEAAAQMDVGDSRGLLRLAAVAALQLLLLRGSCLGVAEGLLGQHGSCARMVGADVAPVWCLAARLGRLGQLLWARMQVAKHVLHTEVSW